MKSAGFHVKSWHSLPTALHETEEFFLNSLIYKVFRWISHEIWQISCGFHEICQISCEIHMKSAVFHMKSARFHEICWISREIRTKSAKFHEIKNVSFWVITKYRSFFRKTNQIGRSLTFLKWNSNNSDNLRCTVLCATCQKVKCLNDSMS